MLQVVAAPVIVQIVADSYTWPTIVLSPLPYAGFITIQGVISDATQVKITTTDVSYAVLVCCSHYGPITFQGVTLIAAAGGTIYGININSGGYLIANGGTVSPASLILQGFNSAVGAAVAVDGVGSVLIAPYLQITGAQYGVFVTGGAEVDITASQIIGVAGWSSNSASTGLLVHFSFAHASGTSISQFYNMVDCQYDSLVSNAGNPFIFSSYTVTSNHCGSAPTASSDGRMLPYLQ